MLKIDSENEQEKARVDDLATEEVFEEFRRAFGS